MESMGEGICAIASLIGEVLEAIMDQIGSFLRLDLIAFKLEIRLPGLDPEFQGALKWTFLASQHKLCHNPDKEMMTKADEISGVVGEQVSEDNCEEEVEALQQEASKNLDNNGEETEGKVKNSEKIYKEQKPKENELDKYEKELSEDYDPLRAMLPIDRPLCHEE